LALARSFFGLGAPALGQAVLRPVDLEAVDLLEDIARSYLEIGRSEAAARFAAQLPEGPVRSAIGADVALSRGDAPTALANLIAGDAPADQRARIAWAASDWPESVRAIGEAIAARGSGAEQSSAKNSLPANTEETPRTANLATRLALAARKTGRGAVPVEALSLAEGEPSLQAGLRAIFARPEDGFSDHSPAAIATYLEVLSAEARLFEEILNDG